MGRSTSLSLNQQVQRLGPELVAATMEQECEWHRCLAKPGKRCHNGFGTHGAFHSIRVAAGRRALSRAEATA